MREFKLFNALGQEYDLNSSESFFHDIKGFGFEKDDDYEQVGNQFIKTASKIKQAAPEGKIRFANYDAYLAFSKFIQKTPLKLQYTSAGTFVIACECQKIEKTEIEAIGLDPPIKFIALGMWYEDVIKVVDGNEAAGKVYPYTYPYIYADSGQGAVVISSESLIESPAKITIYGPCVNPSWTHYVNGVIEKTGKIICSISSNRRLVISTEEPYKIIETDVYGNELVDRYQDSDFGTERFVLLKNGENKISFTHEGTETLQVVVEGMIYYDTV